MNTEIAMTHPRTLMGAALALLSCAGDARDNGRGDWQSDPARGHYRAHAEFKMGRYAQARAVWEALAEAGDGEALFQLGTLAEHGLGEPRNPARAEALYRRAARAG